MAGIVRGCIVIATTSAAGVGSFGFSPLLQPARVITNNDAIQRKNVKHVL
jgi:hypothetical protein